MPQTITITTEFFRENGVIVGLAPQLNVSSHGKNLKEARASLSEAIAAFLETCEEIGTIREVLEEAGFVAQENRYAWQPPKLFRQEQCEFKLTSNTVHA